ncbi:hypothetical protein CEE45_06815 [Candidatus Heimdallarchaeota archaeon B3_Heim]|nr:MAG: hypothetical protein CEE45_06815 [Candidatus Heimdallarchaeota archaeon B3_Heim]
MTGLKILIRDKRRGQMFILATMLIAVYVVAISATVLNIGTQQITSNEETLREPYNNIKRELQSFLEMILARYTDNTSSLNASFARIELESFLTTIEAVDSSRLILTNLELISSSFTINALMTPNSNVSAGSVYTSAINARFHLEISNLYSTMTLIEEFSVSYVGRVEIFSNQVIIQQSRYSILDFINAANIYVLNGSSSLFPNPYSNITGLYYFEDISSIDNVGILSVTFPNGVRIYS